MPCGLFGKLSAKRDFISVNMPREVLLPWEQWLQSSIAASKNDLQAAWLNYYLQAPLWRFLLGEDICGIPVQGVFMPSLDGVGRHFPLTVFTFASAGLAFEAPSEAADQGWYEIAEDFLLATIDAGDDYDLVLQRLALLPEGTAAERAPAAECRTLHGALVSVPAQPSVIIEPERTPEQAISPALDRLPADDASAEDRCGTPAWQRPISDAPAPEASAAALGVGDATAHDDAGAPLSASLAPISDAGAGSGSGSGGADEVEVQEVPQPGEPAPALALSGPAGCLHPPFGFAALAERQRCQAIARQSFWWTIGSHDLPAMVLAADGLPNPQLMNVMLRGLERPEAS
jgi:type VI secretion system protein ImpM